VLTSQALAAREAMATTLATTRAVQARSQLLLRLSRALAEAETVPEVSDILTDLLREELHVAHFGLLVRDRTYPRARYVDMSTFPAGTDPAWAEFDLTTSKAPAARAIAEGRGYFCDDLAALHAVAPEMAVEGAWTFPGAVVILPLQLARDVLGNRTIGALVLVWPSARSTSEPGDRVLWRALADYTSQTLARVQLTAERRSSAETLQQAMLTALPEPDHLDLRARYVPAVTSEQVGGDWYDAVVMPDGATTLVIGDVAGHDMAAAAQMGQLRSMTRTLGYAYGEPPSLVLNRLEDVLAGLRIDTLATMVLARIEQSGADAAAGLRRLRWSNAGHPPPVLLHADGSTEVLEGNDLLIGLNTDLPRHDHTHSLPPGSTLLLFTDGLIEHRGRSITDGLADLLRVLSRCAGLALEVLLDVLQRELIGDRPDDDCAVLAVRAHPKDSPRPAEAGPGHV